MIAPNYLVKAPNGNLYGYWDEVILRINIIENNSLGTEIYKMGSKNTVLEYYPITQDSLFQERQRLINDEIRSVGQEVIDAGKDEC
jgi:hypothetical protein